METLPLNRIETAHHSNGVVQYKTTYVNGRKHGVETRWDDDNQKKSEEMWRKGEKHGVDTYWDEGYAKIWQTIFSKGDAYGVETVWHKNGSRRIETYFIRSKVIAQILWDEKGNVSEVKFPKYLNKHRTEKKSYQPTNKLVCL